MSDKMTFPETWEEFEKSYGFTDSEEVYTNGSRLIPSFRVKQWIDHEESKQQATVSSECISRQAAIDAIDRLDIPEDMCVFEILSHIELEIGTLPSAQPEHLVKESGDLVKDLVNDCISRQAVLDLPIKRDICWFDGSVDEWINVEDIKELPSAETECTCCEYRVGDLCCYSDVKTDMEAMEEVEEE